MVLISCLKNIFEISLSLSPHRSPSPFPFPPSHLLIIGTQAEEKGDDDESEESEEDDIVCYKCKRGDNDTALLLCDK